VEQLASLAVESIGLGFISAESGFDVVVSSLRWPEASGADWRIASLSVESLAATRRVVARIDTTEGVQVDLSAEGRRIAWSSSLRSLSDQPVLDSCQLIVVSTSRVSRSPVAGGQCWGQGLPKNLQPSGPVNGRAWPSCEAASRDDLGTVPAYTPMGTLA
jgi:hypothetical protein